MHMPLLAFLAAGFIGGYDQRLVIGAEGLLLFWGLVLAGLLYAWPCYRCFEAPTAKVRRFVLAKTGLSSA
jgi:peptidoglycan/LPS O-acetylase OafA/YrhL